MPCYGISQWYDVVLCFGVNLCYSVSSCCGINLCYSVNSCYGVNLSNDINLCYGERESIHIRKVKKLRTFFVRGAGLNSMQVALYLAGEITQVKEAIPWVRCASGNV